MTEKVIKLKGRSTNRKSPGIKRRKFRSYNRRKGSTMSRESALENGSWIEREDSRRKMKYENLRIYSGPKHEDVGARVDQPAGNPLTLD